MKTIQESVESIIRKTPFIEEALVCENGPSLMIGLVFPNGELIRHVIFLLF